MEQTPSQHSTRTRAKQRRSLNLRPWLIDPTVRSGNAMCVAPALTRTRSRGARVLSMESHVNTMCAVAARRTTLSVHRLAKQVQKSQRLCLLPDSMFAHTIVSMHLHHSMDLNQTCAGGGNATSATTSTTLTCAGRDVSSANILPAALVQMSDAKRADASPTALVYLVPRLPTCLPLRFTSQSMLITHSFVLQHQLLLMLTLTIPLLPFTVPTLGLRFQPRVLTSRSTAST